MKSYALVGLMLVLLATEAPAQGTVYFGNGVLSQPPDRLVRDSSGQPIVGEHFLVQLLYDTAADSFAAHPEIARFYGTAEFRGWWQGGFRNLTGAGGAFVPVRMQVR